MSRVWIEDRIDHADYKAAVARARVTGRRAPGRYRVRWYDPTGKPKAKVVTRKVDAEAERTKIESKLTDGTYRDPNLAKVKLAVVADEWLGSLVHTKRSTLGRYRGAYLVHILPRWGTTPLNQIKFEDVAKWLADLLSGDATGGRKLKPRSVRKIYNVFNLILGFALRSERLSVNPAQGMKLPKALPADHVYLTHVQVEELADAAKEYRLLVLVLAYTGLRLGEAIALKAGRVDLDTRRAHIVEAYAQEYNSGQIYLDTPKDHERRSVPLPAFLVKELREYMKDLSPNDLLFTAPEGGPVNPNNFRRRQFGPAVTAAGLADLGITPHKLRHTAASLAIAAGADVKVVQTMLGHKTATMTLDVYGHLWPDRLDEVSRKMNKARAEQLAKAKAKAEKAEKKARKAAATLAALEQCPDASSA
ncbi:tyrosine-type recombinase/integrase [Kitasatospora sp. CM 4170]|uniref:Tyrosine-type recombinase/integrase n=1 Tax=Kitasatospora aburaviensis TaxID=67265 RepID=A0ABW1EZB0_9ACTN|nr:tyrosine-type recombinase/integrase [Kitasatospora sp. CM 4170]WNM47334.1 tyrosine-type recombinase/integrase [Kitasatospora sp. CM 4170]